MIHSQYVLHLRPTTIAAVLLGLAAWCAAEETSPSPTPVGDPARVSITKPESQAHSAPRAQLAPAFPGAEGFGAMTQGGRGGTVLFVTNLEDYEPGNEKPIPGSLRAAIETQGPRIILFCAGGLIQLKAPLVIKEPRLTLAGQTAPGDGICLANYPLLLQETHDVVIRYLRCRPGDVKGVELDALSSGSGCRNIILDHCSVSWGTDETLSISGAGQDLITVQWCLISESLDQSVHQKGAHGYASLLRTDGRVTFHHNLYAHHRTRCPRPGTYGEEPGLLLDFRNNVVYNWNAPAGYTAKDPARINYIGNYLKPGPSTTDRTHAFRIGGEATRMFVAGNIVEGVGEENEDDWTLISDAKAEHKMDQSFPIEAVVTESAMEAFVHVLESAGATLPVRDSVDTRVVHSVRNGVGRIINSQADVGGWPEYKGGDAPADADQDGLPDQWELKYGLDPHDSADSASDEDQDVYTTIEEFINGTDPRQPNLPGVQRLWNGITLPSSWPPHYEISIETESDVMQVPYLASPPELIPIDVGRQLFVDDFLIEETTMQRTYHQAQYYSENPVLEPDQPWETGTSYGGYSAPTAMVYSDGVWWDPQDGCFKMWYMGGYQLSTCFAVSHDGIHWTKPELDVVPGTNIVNLQTGEGRGSTVVWLNTLEKDPTRRYIMFKQHGEDDGDDYRMLVFYSHDGIHWGRPLSTAPYSGDRSTAFYNPFRDAWVFSIKQNLFGRRRKYAEAANLQGVANAWEHGDSLPVWVGADRLDVAHPAMPDKKNRELYNLDANAYESLLLGLFTIYPGKPSYRPKLNQVFVGFSRDGFHWHRPDRRPFLSVSGQQGDWNYGNVQSAGGCCLVVGDKLYFYCSGRAGHPGTNVSGRCTTGLAFLRRDGFASMDSGHDPETLTTRPVRFNGKHLFVNVDAPTGELRAEVLDSEGNVIEPFTKEDCVMVQTDSTATEVRWRQAKDLSAVAGKALRFRFHVQDGRFYSLWVSKDESGASRGYVAAGGPGLSGPLDTAGIGAR